MVFYQLSSFKTVVTNATVNCDHFVKIDAYAILLKNNSFEVTDASSLIELVLISKICLNIDTQNESFKTI
jgi:hypothetical protein